MWHYSWKAMNKCFQHAQELHQNRIPAPFKKQDIHPDQFVGIVRRFRLLLTDLLYVSNELGYDSQFNNQRHIYRLIREFSSPTGIGTTPATAAPYGPTLVSDYSADIIRSTRIFPDEGLISIGQRHLQEESLCFADSNFFEMFSFPVIVGNRAEVLDQPNFAVLSEEAAAKYFGDEDPIGQTFEIDGRYSFIVSGHFS